LIVEELETAKKRGAHIYCEIVGLRRVVGRALDGPAARRRRRRGALHEAWRLKDARMGSGARRLHQPRRHLDQAGRHRRDDGVKTVFGDHAKKLAMSSTKSMPATRSAPPVASRRRSRAAIERGILPPTVNWKSRTPSAIYDYVPNPVLREAKIDVALVEQLRLRRHQTRSLISRATRGD